MAQLKSSVKASTLIEVIVAMVIILIVFSLAIGIYNNVLGSADSAKKEQLNALMLNIIQKSITDKNWQDEEFDEADIHLKKTVTNYEEFVDMMVIKVTASEHDRQVGMIRQIVKRNRDVH